MALLRWGLSLHHNPSSFALQYSTQKSNKQPINNQPINNQPGQIAQI